MTMTQEPTEQPIDPARVPVRETVGIFPDEPSMQAAIDELHLAGFDRFELSVVDHEKLEAPDAPSAALADDPATPRRPYTDPESVHEAEAGLVAGFALVPAMGAAAVAAGTGAAIVATAATGGLGALIGGGLAYAIARRHAAQKAALLAQDNLMLFVRTRSDTHERKAAEIFKRNGADHVSAHD